MSVEIKKSNLKRIAYICCLGVIAIISTEFGIVGVLPQISQYYNITIDHAGILLSAFAMTIFLLGPFFVLYTSGINRKKIMIAVVSLFLISNLVSAFSPPFVILLIFRIIPAILQPVFFAAAMGTIIRSAEKKDRTSSWLLSLAESLFHRSQ